MVSSLLLMAAVLLLDRLTKALAMRLTAPAPLVPGVLQLHLAYNTGAAFSLLSHHPWLTQLLSTLLLVCGGFCLWRLHLGRLPKIGALLILSGGLSNWLDRLLWGYVVDMIELTLIPFPIFNVADMAIVCGTALLLFSLLFRPNDWSNTHV